MVSQSCRAGARCARREPHYRSETYSERRQVDKAKGNAKEAGGNLTGDDSLKNEGKADQAAGTVKEKTDKAVDKVKDALDRDR